MTACRWAEERSSESALCSDDDAAPLASVARHAPMAPRNVVRAIRVVIVTLRRWAIRVGESFGHGNAGRYRVQQHPAGASHPPPGSTLLRCPPGSRTSLRTAAES